MHTAVVIPARPFEPHLFWVLEGLAHQRLSPGHTFEVWVGIDGGGDEEHPLNGVGHSFPLSIRNFVRMGAAGVRNALVAQASGDADLLIFINADTRPDPVMVQSHRDAIRLLPARTLALGAAPWERSHPTILDVLIDTRPMIFSYCHMQPHNWYDFRCSYSLNLSVRRKDFLECGGFPESLRPFYYEDLAFGCRLLGPKTKGVWHAPEARVLHRHPLTLDQYLDREELLGLMAPVLAKTCPDAFERLMANRSIRQIEHEFSLRTRHDPQVYKHLYQRLAKRLAVPFAENPLSEQSLEELYQWHLPVKLMAFRSGFLKGLELQDDQNWINRVPQGLWRRAMLN